MIAYIKGSLAEKSPTRVVVEACGVGYELIIPLSTYDSMPHLGESIKLLTYHCIREDDEILFGFATEDERELFTKLTSVSGVGPKIAIAILSGASIGELSRAIAGGDAKRISAIKGVGKKTAEKICIELKDKVSAFAGGEFAKTAERVGAADAIAALRALGFNEETSAKMVMGVINEHPDANNTEKIIKLALASR